MESTINLPKIIATYFNSIGILQIKITNLKFLKNNDRNKVFHKCEDGELKVLIKGSDKIENEIENKLQFSLFFSKSMVLKLKDTLIKIKIDDLNIGQEIFIRYYTTNNLLNNEKIIEKLEFFKSNIVEYFLKGTSNEGNENIEKINLKNIWSDITYLKCKNCNEILLQGLNENEICTLKSKLMFNFNYDYMENLEILSCHEGDINNVIPNLETKLKTL
jgi:hypothetical protein